MINYDPKAWFGIIFRLHKSDTMLKLLPTIGLLGLFTAVFCYIDMEHMQLRIRSTLALHSLVGFVVSMLLVFRTNSAYDRWWEGRKAWGGIVNTTRNLAIKLRAAVTDNHTREVLRLHIVNWVRATKEHLRNGVVANDLEHAPDIDMTRWLAQKHVPNAIMTNLYAHLLRLRQQGTITEQQLLAIDAQVTTLTDLLGACERIKKSPIPYSYGAFIKKTIFIYVITLPVGLVNEFGYMTVPITAFVFYILASLELIAEEIEDPFGRDANDLPTDVLTDTIDTNLKELLRG